MEYKLLCLMLAGSLGLEGQAAGIRIPVAQGQDSRSNLKLSPTAPAGQLTIRIYDYAELHPKQLARTRQVASRLLAAAGIDVRWEQCRTSDKDQNQDASCTQRAGANVIQLRIHPSKMSKKLTSRSVEFGYSIPLEDGFGIIAGVYLERTSRTAKSLGLGLHVMLGHTIAHEIGHLLLGTNSHAKTGVMRPTWGDRDVRLANTGRLGFTEAQARQMQDQVARRITSVKNRARTRSEPTTGLAQSPSQTDNPLDIK